jgi:pimeloyl-ACP methyl ester carboxylesterase
MADSIRSIASPTVQRDGSLTTFSITSPPSFTPRAGVPVPPNKVIPVIFVPGIMGSNLKSIPSKPGEKSEPVWRPPNGPWNGRQEAKKWESRKPNVRQRMLDPDFTEVDEDGPIESSNSRDRDLFRRRGWGSVHSDSYGSFLDRLQRDLNHTFTLAYDGEIQLQRWWSDVVNADRAKWDAADLPALTQAELRRFSEYQYPVYAVGYNWLRTNAEAAEYLARKIETWVTQWKTAGFRCDKVILVSHSMGGLVCRAYARQHEDRVLGVVHGVQPAVGAPLCYRRIACGTEQTAPGNGGVDNLKMEYFAMISGRTPAETQPVMAVSPGPLELLPCHLHPPGWLKALVATGAGNATREVLSLPKADPYDEIYRNTQNWYRLFDPALIDPGDKYQNYTCGTMNGPIAKVVEAISRAEHFHKSCIGNYYHPNTWAFYGNDPKFWSFGTVRWLGRWTAHTTLTETELLAATPASSNLPGQIVVRCSQTQTGQAQDTEKTATAINFAVQLQDTRGDGTVNWQSGSAPHGRSGVKRLFATTGYDHQGGYKDEPMRLLTLYLICKIAQMAH